MQSTSHIQKFNELLYNKKYSNFTPKRVEKCKYLLLIGNSSLSRLQSRPSFGFFRYSRTLQCQAINLTFLIVLQD